jgi:ATP adenylyltransferase
VSASRLWAGWRSRYVSSGPAEAEGCVFCAILAGEVAQDQVVWRDDKAAVIVNAYPYTSGHLLVMPVRHLGDIEDLEPEESTACWELMRRCVRALRAAYSPDGFNLGANLGRPAGAGIPDHLHLHCLPRWNGDTNFMTTVADTRVLPEALADTSAKVRSAWPDA